MYIYKILFQHHLNIERFSRTFLHSNVYIKVKTLELIHQKEEGV